MIWEEFRNRPSVDEVLAVQRGARDNIYVCDAGGLAEKVRFAESHGVGYYFPELRAYRDGLEHGDLSRVAASEKFLREIEEQVPVSRTYANTADVTGSLPIVPALLAGHPQAMRMRRRLKRPAGPLTLFLETTGSGGIRADAADLRGAAMLALTRKLAEYCAVDLWVCTTYGTYHEMNAIVCRVETTPLDLGRAAHMLGNLAASASVGAAVLQKVNGRSGSWSYGSQHMERTWAGTAFQRLLSPSSDMLFVPAAFWSDEWSDPTAWLKRMLVKYGGETIEGYGEVEAEAIDDWTEGSHA